MPNSISLHKIYNRFFSSTWHALLVHDCCLCLANCFKIQKRKRINKRITLNLEIYLNAITLMILALLQQEEIYVGLARLLYRKT